MEQIREKWGIDVECEFDNDTKAKDINEVFIEAFKAFVKSEINT